MTADDTTRDDVRDDPREGARHDAQDDPRTDARTDDAHTEASPDADRRANDRRATDRDAVHPERVRAAIRHELGADDAKAAQEAAAQADASPDPAPAQAVVELDDVWLAFDRPILEGVSFAAYPGETVAVVGESGTGKSTILKLILRLLRADRGHVYVQGRDIGELTYDEALKMRQQMGMVFQGSALFDSLSVFENVAYPLREHTTLDDAGIAQRVRETLQFVDLDPDEVVNLAPSELSGGMQKRVGIARGLAAHPRIMLYDEPTSGLDPLTTATITNLIMKLQRELSVTSIVVTHDIRSAFRMASKIALLHDRHIVFFGTPEEMAGSDDAYVQTFLGGY